MVVKFTTAEINARLKGEGFSLVGEYFGSTIKTEIICDCGHQFTSTTSAILYRFKKCPMCKDIGKNRRTRWNTYMKEYSQKQDVKYRNAITIAKERGIEFSLTYDEYIECTASTCYYCNFQLGHQTIYACGLDRLDNNKGYVVGNVVSCCKSCNRVKGHLFTAKETKAAIDAVLHFRQIQRTNI